MARSLNSVTLLGALNQNAELRYTQGGLAILDVPISGIDHVTDHNGEPVELSWYHRATLFGQHAEDLVDTLTQGTIVYVNGRLNYRTWKDKNNNQTRNSLDVHALRINVITPPNDLEKHISPDARGQPRLNRGAINRVEIIGNTTREPNTRLLPGRDYGLTRLTVAVNDEYRDRNGTNQSRTHYVDVELWRDLAIQANDTSKGAPVYVAGRFKLHSWTDKDNNKRYTNRIEATHYAEFTRPTKTIAPFQSNSAAATAATTNRGNLDIDEQHDLPF